MYLFALALRHPTAPISIREKFAILSSKMELAYTYFLSQNIPAFIVSTCNRSEIYIYQKDENINPVIRWWAEFCNEDFEELQKYLDIYTEKKAIIHLFEVCSGIDSMVIGETQISKQIKDSYTIAQKYKSLNSNLHTLIQKSINCAKQIRTQTDISKFSVSFAAAGVLLAKKIFNDINEQNMLFIGAGEMMQTLAPHFASQNPNKITILNRNLDNAQNLIDTRLKSFNDIDIKSINELEQVLPDYDIIVCCIEYNKILINKSMIANSLKKRKFKPLYLLDLSVPIIIEKTNFSDVYFYNVDDLSTITNQAQSNRLKAKEQAKSIIQNHLEQYETWQKTQSSLPLINIIQDYMQKNMQEHLEYAKKQAPSDNLEKTLQKFTQKNTHDWLKLITILSPEQQNLVKQHFENKF